MTTRILSTRQYGTGHTSPSSTSANLMPPATVQKISANDYIYGGDPAKWKQVCVWSDCQQPGITHQQDVTSPPHMRTELIDAASKIISPSNADNATVRVAGGGAAAAQGAYNNFWGVNRVNLSRVYWQHEYAVQVFTGSVPEYD
ncbi:MAG: hypothetical protein MZV63_20635 [Marinilabiliales bacterium]|nr:hypothetical protein [Marinilabiliales bacterium]